MDIEFMELKNKKKMNAIYLNEFNLRQTLNEYSRTKRGDYWLYFDCQRPWSVSIVCLNRLNQGFPNGQFFIVVCHLEGEFTSDMQLEQKQSSEFRFEQNE